jgi:hypothetical protein
MSRATNGMAVGRSGYHEMTMCACGCFLVLGFAAALAFCIMHRLWIPAAGVVTLAGLVGWLAAKAMKKSDNLAKPM